MNPGPGFDENERPLLLPHSVAWGYVSSLNSLRVVRFSFPASQRTFPSNEELPRTSDCNTGSYARSFAMFLRAANKCRIPPIEKYLPKKLDQNPLPEIMHC